MALEDIESAGKYISDLVDTNPVGSTDNISDGDGHIRGIKNTIVNTFTNITGPVTTTQAELNLLDGVPAGLTTTEIGYLDGVTSSIQTQLNAKEATGVAAALVDDLSGVTNAATARTNLGLGALATLDAPADGSITQAKMADMGTGSIKLAGWFDVITITNPGTTWTKALDCYCGIGGSFTFNFELASTSTTDVYARIYIDGVYYAAAGTKSATGTTYETETGTVSGVTDGQSVQVYVSAVGTGPDVRVRNFALLANKSYSFCVEPVT